LVEDERKDADCLDNSLISGENEIKVLTQELNELLVRLLTGDWPFGEGVDPSIDMNLVIFIEILGHISINSRMCLR